MTLVVALAFSAAVLRISVPYALGALGGTFSERAGVINLALEGMMLCGAFSAIVFAYATGSATLGVLFGTLGGVALAAIYAGMVLLFSADQIVCGVAVNLLADGFTRFLLKTIYDSSSNSPRVSVFGGSTKTVLIGVAILLVVLSQILFSHTRFGLRLRAVGEHPEAARSLGVRPTRVRLTAVLISGALAGLGGVFLAVDQRQFVANMSGGRGYIALTAMIFGGWRPLYGALASLLFGFAEALQIALQAAGIGLPGWLVQMLPYLLTLALLGGFVGRVRGRDHAPKALGKPAASPGADHCG